MNKFPKMIKIIILLFFISLFFFQQGQVLLIGIFAASLDPIRLIGSICIGVWGKKIDNFKIVLISAIVYSILLTIFIYITLLGMKSRYDIDIIIYQVISTIVITSVSFYFKNILDFIISSIEKIVCFFKRYNLSKFNYGLRVNNIFNYFKSYSRSEKLLILIIICLILLIISVIIFIIKFCG